MINHNLNTLTLEVEDLGARLDKMEATLRRLSLFVARSAGEPSELVRGLLRSSHRFQAIKEYAAATGLGSPEAELALDMWEESSSDDPKRLPDK